MGLELARQNEFVPNQFVVKIPRAAEADPVRVAAKLNRSSEVEFATPNFLSQHHR